MQRNNMTFFSRIYVVALTTAKVDDFKAIYYIQRRLVCNV